MAEMFRLFVIVAVVCGACGDNEHGASNGGPGVDAPVGGTADAPVDGGATTDAPIDAMPRGPLMQRAYLKASNAGRLDSFGFNVVVSADGSTLAVSANTEAGNGTGAGGNPADNTADNSGAVYVFVRAGATWSQQAYLKASNTGIDDQFGASLALSADGSTLAVGAPFEDSAATGINGDGTSNAAPGAGAVYVFTRSGTTWVQQAYVKASNTGANDFFGVRLALSGDGSTLAVGADGEDSAAVGVGGAETDNAAADAGAVYVFGRGGTTWTQQAYIKASNTETGDLFGYSVALSGDGATLAVCAFGEASATTGVDGDQTSNAATRASAVYVFSRGAGWTQQAYVKASNTRADALFGASLALSGDGATLAVGAYGEASAAKGVGGNEADTTAPFAGAAYVFTRAGATWTKAAYIKASNTGAADLFGYSLALSADGASLAVGAEGEDSAAAGIGGNQTGNTLDGAGAVYLFTRAATWTQRAYVKASNPDASDLFGVSVGLSGDGSTLAVGAYFEASAATGIGGDQADDTAPNAGAAYVFE
jgi:trimeric autotransporter adhesin